MPRRWSVPPWATAGGESAAGDVIGRTPKQPSTHTNAATDALSGTLLSWTSRRTTSPCLCHDNVGLHNGPGTVAGYRGTYCQNVPDEAHYRTPTKKPWKPRSSRWVGRSSATVAMLPSPWEVCSTPTTVVGLSQPSGRKEAGSWTTLPLASVTSARPEVDR